MTTYLETIAQRVNANTHHAFVLHGGTRDLQLGKMGSCSLVDHILETFAALPDSPRLVAVYRVGLGWSFALESDRANFTTLVGLAAASNDPFAGMSGSASAGDLPLDAATAVGLIDIAMRQSDQQVVIVIDRAELVAANQGYDRMSAADKAILSILQSVASERRVEDTSNLLILITDVLIDLHESLRLATSRYYAIEIFPPDYGERLAIGEKVLPQLIESGCNVELSAQEFATATSMLSRYGLMDVLRDGRASASLSRSQVREIKSAAMAQEYGEIIETLDPLPNGFLDIAGMVPLKNYFRSVVDHMVAANYSDVPTGILCAGAAGLGKSFFMRGLAGECGLPTINFNIGKVLGSFVGQSEKNLERAITAIKSASPCIVVIDEIESVFPNRASGSPNGDSGVSSRILKRMLEVLSDPALRGRVLWIGITNYPQNLDAALARAGRFDVVVAFVPPSKSEIVALIELYSVKYGLSVSYAGIAAMRGIDEIAASLAGYTNAEIENVARKSRQLNAQGMDFTDSWQEAIARVRSNTRGVLEMTNAALLAVNDSDLLPSEYIAQWRRVTQQETLPAQKSGSLKSADNKSLF